MNDFLEFPVQGEKGKSRREIIAYCIIDNEFSELLSYVWRINRGGYIYRQSWRKVNGKKKRCNLYIHREILGLQPGNPLEGHHKTDNPLDNRFSQLEAVHPLINQMYKKAKGVIISQLEIVQNA